jgi:hypothetical protein
MKTQLEFLLLSCCLVVFYFSFPDCRALNDKMNLKRKPIIRLKGSVTLTTWHPLSAKIWQSLRRQAAVARSV